jgi:hypothetical protein
MDRRRFIWLAEMDTRRFASFLLEMGASVESKNKLVWKDHATLFGKLERTRNYRFISLGK